MSIALLCNMCICELSMIVPHVFERVCLDTLEGCVCLLHCYVICVLCVSSMIVTSRVERVCLDTLEE